jgi:hypothetical protein
VPIALGLNCQCYICISRGNGESPLSQPGHLPRVWSHRPGIGYPARHLDQEVTGSRVGNVTKGCLWVLPKVGFCSCPQIVLLCAYGICLLNGLYRTPTTPRNENIPW